MHMHNVNGGGRSGNEATMYVYIQNPALKSYTQSVKSEGKHQLYRCKGLGQQSIYTQAQATLIKKVPTVSLCDKTSAWQM